jgi:thiamine monophosphate synthase
MRLEDAMLGVSLPAAEASADLAAALVAAGVDLLVFEGSGPGVAGAAEAATAADALVLVRDEAAAAQAAGVAGVVLEGDNPGIGLARAVLGFEALVAVLAETPQAAVLAAELDADAVLYAGPQPGATLAGLREGARAQLFAAGVDGAASARALMEGGVYRVVLSGAALGAAAVEEARNVARLLGRTV